MTQTERRWITAAILAAAALTVALLLALSAEAFTKKVPEPATPNLFVKPCPHPEGELQLRAHKPGWPWWLERWKPIEPGCHTIPGLTDDPKKILARCSEGTAVEARRVEPGEGLCP